MDKRKVNSAMKNKLQTMKFLYLACSAFGIAYFVLSIAALFVGGGMRELFFSTVTGSTGDIMYMASILFWWVSVQLYLNALPEHKLPDWAKKLCVANMATYLGVLALRLLDIYVI